MQNHYEKDDVEFYCSLKSRSQTLSDQIQNLDTELTKIKNEIVCTSSQKQSTGETQDLDEQET